MYRKTKSSLRFVREGEKPTTTVKKRRTCYKSPPPPTWDVKIDLGEKLQFPRVDQATIRPDVAL